MHTPSDDLWLTPKQEGSIVGSNPAWATNQVKGVSEMARQLVRMIEWQSANIENRVYDIYDDGDTLTVCSGPNFVGRWKTMEEIEAFITLWMQGTIMEEV